MKSIVNILSIVAAILFVVGLVYGKQYLDTKDSTNLIIMAVLFLVAVVINLVLARMRR